MTLIKSFKLTDKYGGTDLRCRIVGARLLASPHSPYFYKWNPRDGEWYLDPNDKAHRLVNGNVVTPAVLTVIYPLSQLPYVQVRWIWAALQMIAGLAILMLLFRGGNFSNRLLMAAPVILGIICSEPWLYHIERGQMYIFYAFIFALMYRFHISSFKYNQFISGFIGGLFLVFRPFAGIISLGFLLHGKKKWLMGWIAGVLLALGTFVLTQPSAWREYFKAMNEYIRLEMKTGSINKEAAIPEMPSVIEGTSNITEYSSFSDDYLKTAYQYFKKVGISMNATQLLLTYGMLLALLSWLFFRLKNKIPGDDSIFLFGFLLFLLSELFTPAPRGGYNLVLWIFPLSLLYLRSKSYLPVLICLATSLLLFHNFPFTFSHQLELAELGFLFLLIYIIFFPASFKMSKNGISGT